MGEREYQRDRGRGRGGRENIKETDGEGEGGRERISKREREREGEIDIVYIACVKVTQCTPQWTDADDLLPCSATVGNLEESQTSLLKQSTQDLYFKHK